MSFRLRDATPDDEPFLKEMWLAAAFWQPEVFTVSMEDALEMPELARYIEGWGRAGDRAVVAEADGERAGAAWYRLFPSSEPGYGFVDERTPELGIAVVPGKRRRGIATALIDAIVARARDEGFEALSLSVNATNPSRQIYERAGFVDVRADEDGSLVMVRKL